MKQSVIQLVDISGSPVACYEIETVEGLAQLYKGMLFKVTSKGLRDYEDGSNKDESISEKYRFVLAANAQEARALSRVEPIRCYLRDHNMNAQVLNLNPYQSVGYLRQLAQGDRKSNVKLVINEKDLIDDSESLLKYIYEDAIVHAIELGSGEKTIGVYTKEPGADSKLFKIENVSVSDNVGVLAREIGKNVAIPQQFLYLVYGGKILLKDKPISDYYIQNNACIYAVDSRKYMRKIPLNEYNKRIAEVKKVKDCNRQVVEKAKEAKHESAQAEKKEGNNKYTYERSGTIMEDLGDDNKYFKEGKMSLESQEFAQFQRRGNKLEESAKLANQAKIIKKVNSELEHGRIVTNTAEVYQDEDGFTHELSKQKSVFRDGYKTVDVNITEDRDGNIIRISQDIVNVKKNSRTGHTVKEQTDIVEDCENNKTVVRKSEVRDREGNVIRYETSRHSENQGGQEGTLALASREPQTSEERLVEVDQDGNIRTRESQLLEKEGKTVFVNKDLYEDSLGNVLAVKTGVVEIQGDDDGNVLKHKSEITETEGKVSMVETRELMDPDGTVIAKEKDEINIVEGEDGSIIKKEMNVIEEEDKTTIIKRGVVEDSSGNIVKSQSKVIEIENSEYGIQVHEQEEVEEIVEGQGEEGTFEKEVQVVEDERGNKITQERQFHDVEGGQPVLYSAITVENPDGDIVAQKTEKIRINEDSEVERHTTKYSEDENKIVISEGRSLENMDGSIIRAENEIFQIEEKEDGSLLKSKTAVTEQDGFQTIHIKKQLEDFEGKLIKKTSDIYELETNSNQMMLTNNEGPLQMAAVQKSQLNRTYNVDNDGNLRVTEKEVRREDGIENVTEREVIYDDSGDIVRKETEIKENVEMGDGHARYTIAEIVEQGNVTTVIETNTLVDPEGNKIRTEQGTLQIEKMKDGLTRKEKQTVIEEGGIKVKVHKSAYEDDQGNVFHEEVKRMEVPNEDAENGKVVSEVVKRRIEEVEQDESGNYRLHQREVQENNDGDSLVVESNILRSEENELVKATTDVLETSLRDDGNVYKREVNIIEKPGKVTVAESAAIQNAEGQRLKGEVSSVMLTQGPNNEIITKETNVYMDGLEKRIVQETVVEDHQGNVTQAKGTAKRITMDQHGNELQREEQSYDAKAQLVLGYEGQEGYSEISREIVQDQEGNVLTIEKQVVQNEQDGTTVIKSQMLENSSGDIIGRNTKVVQIQNLQHGSIIKQQNEYIEGDRIIQDETLTIADREGTILSQKEKKIEITEDEGLIRTSKTGTVRRQGETRVGIVETLEDEDGNIIDQSSNMLKIRDSEDALKEHARKVANAEMTGEVKSVVRQYADDQEGNRHMIEKQVIENDGKTITVNTRTIQSPEGELLHSKTEITQEKLENGVVKKYETEITEEGGLVQVVEFAELGGASNQLGYSGQMSSEANSSNLNQLLGLDLNEPVQTGRMQVKLTDSITNEVDLLGNPFEEGGRPVEFDIIAIDKQRNETRLRVRYDESIDEVGKKLAEIIGKPSGRIQFFKDGNELPEYELVSDFEIGPGDQLYYVDEHQ